MQEGQISLHIGRVIVAGAYANHYFVEIEGQSITAAALETGSSRRGGHTSGTCYSPGGVVLIAKLREASALAQYFLSPNLIIGSFDVFPKQEGSVFSGLSIQEGSLAGVENNAAYREVVKTSGPSSDLRQSRSSNRFTDAQPGDWYKSTALGGIFLLSEFMCKAGIAPDCAITFSGIDSQADLTARNYVQDHLSYLRESIHRGDVATDVEQYALSILEAIGGQSALQEYENEDGTTSIVPATENATGLFRHQAFRGGASEGVYDTMRTDFSEGGPYTFGEETYPGTLSVLQRMDGIYRVRAAKEIKLEKTYAIVSPWKKEDIACAAPAEGNDFPAEYSDLSDAERLREAFGLSSIDEVYRLMPLMHDEFATYEEATTYFQGLRKDDGIWHFPTIEEVREAVFPGESTTKVRPLESQESEYTIADLVSEDKEIYPGRKVKLFKNSSVFLMSDDGGLVLGDGYGGEIRMNRGRVTIASIGDVEILPGRDLIEQVPGNRINRTKGRVEVSSTEGSIAIKAEGNLQMLSGGSSGGMLTLENRSEQGSLNDIDEQALNEGLPFGSGIQLKAPSSGVSILGSHIYGSGYSSDVDGEGSDRGVESDTTTCDILFDSGNGSTTLRGQNLFMSYAQSASLTMLESATGIFMRDNSILSISRGPISVVTPLLTVDKAGGAINNPALEASGVADKVSDLPREDPRVEINGDIGLRGSVLAKGQILSEKSVVSNDGANVDPITIGRRISIELAVPEAGNIEEYEDVTSLFTTSLRLLYEDFINKGLATQKGQRSSSFAFPSSGSAVYGASSFSLVAPKWQTILDTENTWQEQAVVHAVIGETYPYPGKERFDAPDALLVQSDDGSIVPKALSEYKVNK